MVPDFVLAYTIVIVLFCLIYFSFASIPFLFVRLDVPEVSRLFRGLFNDHFLMVRFTGIGATAGFAATRPNAVNAAMLLPAVPAMGVRSTLALPSCTHASAWLS